MEHMPIALCEIPYRQFRPILGFEFGAKGMKVVARQRQPLRVECCEVRHLPEANGRCDLRHIVFPAQYVDVNTVETAAADALQTVFLRQLRLIGVIDNQATTFSSHDVLVHLKTEGNEIADCTDVLALPTGPYRLRGIFDDA